MFEDSGPKMLATHSLGMGDDTFSLSLEGDLQEHDAGGVYVIVLRVLEALRLEQRGFRASLSKVGKLQVK